jgi:hypothetical protein
MQNRFAKLVAWSVLPFCLLLTAAGSAAAQDLQRSGGAYTLPPGSMPAWTVPVLRLVSATHVEPTTGIVLSDNGLVLVPGDFAGASDEIIVLDGGTDIIRNGRPARIERKFALEGLMVLSVQGLKRSGVTLAARPLEDGSEIELTAFPPAEQIALGEPPLRTPASVTVFSENGRPSLTSETALPNVTGALVDSCGYLVGFSMADDVQTMETSPATRYQWRDSLLRLFNEMRITVRESECEAAGEPEQPAEEPVAEVPAADEPAVDEPVAEDSAPEEEPIPVPVPEEEPEVEPPPEAEQEELPRDILPPIESGQDDARQNDTDRGGRNWLWLLAALFLFGLGLLLHRIRRGQHDQAAGSSELQAAQPGPSLQPGDEESEAPLSRLDSLLLIQGVLADGTAFEDSCPVSENAINVTIGRSDADLVIESRAVSRQHARLNGNQAELTISDLGSSNGTSINGVPCLEGEIMFIEPGDTLILGDARCTIEIRPHQPAGGVKE